MCDMEKFIALRKCEWSVMEFIHDTYNWRELFIIYDAKLRHSFLCFMCFLEIFRKKELEKILKIFRICLCM